METKEKPQAITVDPAKCGKPMIVEVTVAVVSSTIFVLIITLIGLMIAAGIYLWRNRGEVEFTKYVEGETVLVTVRNGTQRLIRDVVIEDVIPTETEIRVHTLNALRSQNTLNWHVGSLKSQESATLSYWVKGGKAVQQSQLTWEKGSKKLSQ
jgi:hypothetical protein